MKVESDFSPVGYLNRDIFRQFTADKVSNCTAVHPHSSPQGEQLDCEAAEGSNSTSKCDKPPQQICSCNLQSRASSGSTVKLVTGEGTARSLRLVMSQRQRLLFLESVLPSSALIAPILLEWSHLTDLFCSFTSLPFFPVFWGGKTQKLCQRPAAKHSSRSFEASPAF